MFYEVQIQKRGVWKPSYDKTGEFHYATKKEAEKAVKNLFQKRITDLARIVKYKNEEKIDCIFPQTPSNYGNKL